MIQQNIATALMRIKVSHKFPLQLLDFCLVVGDGGDGGGEGQQSYTTCEINSLKRFLLKNNLTF